MTPMTRLEKCKAAYRKLLSARESADGGRSMRTPEVVAAAKAYANHADKLTGAAWYLFATWRGEERRRRGFGDGEA